MVVDFFQWTGNVQNLRCVTPKKLCCWYTEIKSSHSLLYLLKTVIDPGPKTWKCCLVMRWNLGQNVKALHVYWKYVNYFLFLKKMARVMLQILPLSLTSPLCEIRVHYSSWTSTFIWLLCLYNDDFTDQIWERLYLAPTAFGMLAPEDPPAIHKEVQTRVYQEGHVEGSS